MKRLEFACVLWLGVVGCGQSGGDTVDGVEGFVCGADGQTYSVKDAADGEHDVMHRGTCDRPMGCDSRADCFAGDECSPHGDSDVCVPVPNDCQCAGVFEPVCGADGRTYINVCEARRPERKTQRRWRRRDGTALLYYTILYYTILYYTITYCTILYYTIPYYTILY